MLSFRVLLQICFATLVVMITMQSWSARQTRLIEDELMQQETRLANFTKKLETETARLASIKTKTKPQRELSNLERELAVRQTVVATLTKVRNTYTRGVSPYLESFSRQSPKGVWLTGFMVQAGGEGLVLRGSSVKPDLIPAFLQNLSTENSLSGTEFGLLQIQRETPNARFVDFTVYTGSKPPATSTLLEEKS